MFPRGISCVLHSRPRIKTTSKIDGSSSSGVDLPRWLISSLPGSHNRRTKLVSKKMVCLEEDPGSSWSGCSSGVLILKAVVNRGCTFYSPVSLVLRPPIIPVPAHTLRSSLLQFVMVSTALVASCLALLASPARGFVPRTTIISRAPGAKIVAATGTSSPRQRAGRGELSMRKTGKFVLSKAAQRQEGAAALTVNTRTGEVLEEVKRETVQQEMAKAGPGLIEPDMELFCKAAADGASLGDCPFTHYIQMVLHYKNLPFEVTPCATDAKPDWLVEDYDGQMPCLVDSGEAYTESSNIADYIEYFYPEPTLSMKDSPEKVAEAKEVTSGMFGKLAKCIKNLDPAEDEKLMMDVTAELEKIDGFLNKGKGPFLCGEDMTLADCSFAPKLYHASTCLAQFKNSIISPDFEALHKYMDTMFSNEAFVKGSYPPDVVVWGWNKARGTEAK